jgi:hypothetical protein
VRRGWRFGRGKAVMRRIARKVGRRKIGKRAGIGRTGRTVRDKPGGWVERRRIGRDLGRGMSGRR